MVVLAGGDEEAKRDLLHGTCALSFAMPSCVGLVRRTVLSQIIETAPLRTWHVAGTLRCILVAHAIADTDSKVESFA